MTEQGVLGQIVDENGVFTTELSKCIKSWGFQGRGLDYSVVAVFGAQSSGKSTLLNLLFNTRFQVMDADKGRSQTTKGLWVGQASNDRTLVMDVEGTDSKERGEDNMAFERKSALFSLAIAEVLIVNVWCADIGRLNASNLGLLKTVLSVNLQLFQKADAPKTLLLFVIRDWFRTPLEKLTATLVGDVDKVWSEIKKPAQFAENKVSDFFDVEVTLMHNYEYERETFNEDAKALQKRFYDSSAPDYVFRPAYKKTVPADGFAAYASQVWDTVIHNRDLDLPSQKEMLALFRCDEIADELIGEQQEEVNTLKATVKKRKIVPALGGEFDKLLESLITKFNERTQLYHQNIVERKREALKTKLLGEYSFIFLQQVTNVSEHQVQEFKRKLGESDPDKLASAFKEQVALMEAETMAAFDKTLNDSLPTGNPSGWEFTQARADVQQHVAEVAAVIREQQVRRQLEKIGQRIKKVVADDVRPLLEAYGPDMWEQLQARHNKITEDAESFLKPLSGFDPSPQEQATWTADAGKLVRAAFVAALREAAEYVAPKMLKRFNDGFRNDANGLPRVWLPSQDLDGVFMKSRQAAYEVLTLFTTLKLSKPADPKGKGEAPAEDEVESETLIASGRAEMIKTQFEGEARAAYVEAKRAQESANQLTRIPPWAVVMIAVLGWNEFWWVVTSPLVFISFVLLGGAAGVIYYLGMQGPAYAMLKMGVNEVLRMVDNFTAAPGATLPPSTTPRAASTTAGTPSSTGSASTPTAFPHTLPTPTSASDTGRDAFAGTPTGGETAQGDAARSQGNVTRRNVVGSQDQ